MKRFKGTRGMIVFLILICMIVGYYCYLSNRSRSFGAEEEEATPVQEVLLRDLSRNYPASPKEVIKYYSELTQCFYNEEYSDEELEQLADRAMELYDEELAAFQPKTSYLRLLKDEIASYKEDDIEVSSYKTSPSTDVTYFTKNGRECASLFCTYTMRQGTSLQYLEEIFILRRDEEGHWKIYGWEIADPNMKQKIEKEDS